MQVKRVKYVSRRDHRADSREAQAAKCREQRRTAPYVERRRRARVMSGDLLPEHCVSGLARRCWCISRREAQWIIRGLSAARISSSSRRGWFRDPGDLLRAQARRSSRLRGYADKGTDSLVAAIEASKSQPLQRLLPRAWNPARGIDRRAAPSAAFWNARALMSASADDILNVRGIGATIANGVVDYFSIPPAALVQLRSRGVNSPSRARGRGRRTTLGKTLVITGTLSLSRAKATATIEAAAGRRIRQIRLKSTRFPPRRRGKRETSSTKAKSLGVTIISERPTSCVGQSSATSTTREIVLIRM